jgi:formylmethanofuran dehydrogenase subunit E
MYITDDPIADFDRWDAEQQMELKKLPTCCSCGEPIQDEDLFDVNGDLFCKECMMEQFKKPVERYIKEG